MDKEFVLFPFESFWWLKRYREGGWRRIKDMVVQKRDRDRELGRDSGGLLNSCKVRGKRERAAGG